jgi:transcriptional regulator of acetoin/glycerol metabolism
VLARLTADPELELTCSPVERDAIVQSLHEAGGSKAAAARALGMSRATIYRRIHE